MHNSTISTSDSKVRMTREERALAESLKILSHSGPGALNQRFLKNLHRREKAAAKRQWRDAR